MFTRCCAVQAFRENFYGERRIWIVNAEWPDRWWDTGRFRPGSSNLSEACGPEQILSASQGLFTTCVPTITDPRAAADTAIPDPSDSAARGNDSAAAFPTDGIIHVLHNARTQESAFAPTISVRESCTVPLPCCAVRVGAVAVPDVVQREFHGGAAGERERFRIRRGPVSRVRLRRHLDNRSHVARTRRAQRQHAAGARGGREIRARRRAILRPGARAARLPRRHCTTPHTHCSALLYSVAMQYEYIVLYCTVHTNIQLAFARRMNALRCVAWRRGATRHSQSALGVGLTAFREVSLQASLML